MQTYTLTEDQFAREYQPQPNHFDDNASWDGCMLETYGEELDYVKTVFQHTPRRVWTVLDCDGETIVVSGFHYVNRMGYIITENPAPEGLDIEVLDADDFDYQSVI
jgi:hypothetical protein